MIFVYFSQRCNMFFGKKQRILFGKVIEKDTKIRRRNKRHMNKKRLNLPKMKNKCYFCA